MSWCGAVAIFPSIVESNQKKINPLCTVESGTGRETDMEKCDPSGYQESVQESYSWSQFLKEMEKRG